MKKNSKKNIEKVSKMALVLILTSVKNYILAMVIVDLFKLYSVIELKSFQMFVVLEVLEYLIRIFKNELPKFELKELIGRYLAKIFLFLLLWVVEILIFKIFFELV